MVCFIKPPCGRCTVVPLSRCSDVLRAINVLYQLKIVQFCTIFSVKRNVSYEFVYLNRFDLLSQSVGLYVLFLMIGCLCSPLCGRFLALCMMNSYKFALGVEHTFQLFQ